jgi:hypothetical protein
MWGYLYDERIGVPGLFGHRDGGCVRCASAYDFTFVVIDGDPGIWAGLFEKFHALFGGHILHLPLSYLDAPEFGCAGRR